MKVYSFSNFGEFHIVKVLVRIDKVSVTTIFTKSPVYSLVEH